MFSEGYIGITRNTAQSRFDKHCRAVNSSKSKDSVISRAIKKYGKENLIVETLVICDIDYAVDLEVKLRPENNIGWNITKGGGLPPVANRTGHVMPEHVKQKLLEANTGRKMSEETRLKRIRASTGRKHSEESILKMKAGKLAVKLWERPFVRLDLWSQAEIYYESFLNGISEYYTEKNFQLKKGSLTSLYKHFKLGWNPSEDPLWISDFKNKEASVG
jgi:hypothetical protein